MYDYQKMNRIRRGPESERELEELYRDLESFCKHNGKVYLYGAGHIGQMYYSLMKKLGVTPAGFIISNESFTAQSPLKTTYVPVYSWETLKAVFPEDGAIILSLSQVHHGLHKGIDDKIPLFHTTDHALQLLYDKELLCPMLRSLENSIMSFDDFPLESKWEHIRHAFGLLHNKETDRKAFPINYIAKDTNCISKIKLKDCAIIMQGPLKNNMDFALETCHYYRAIYPNTPIVISTWKDEINDKFRHECHLENVIVIESDVPTGFDYVNANKQIYSSRRGLEYVRENYPQVKYALKCRVDQRILMRDFLLYFRSLSLIHPVRDTLESRLIFAGSGVLWTPFYLTDFILFGNINDTIKYYFERDINSCEEADFAASAERFISRTFIRKYIGFPSGIKAYSQEEINIFLQFLRHYAIIADMNSLYLYWPKYIWSRWDYGHQRYMNYAQWLEYCYGDISGLRLLSDNRGMSLEITR